MFASTVAGLALGVTFYTSFFHTSPINGQEEITNTPNPKVFPEKVRYPKITKDPYNISPTKRIQEFPAQIEEFKTNRNKHFMIINFYKFYNIKQEYEFLKQKHITLDTFNLVLKYREKSINFIEAQSSVSREKTSPSIT